MKNLPKNIFLQIGDGTKDTKNDEVDFNKLGGVSWCTEKIHDTDIPYVLKSTTNKNRFFGKSVISKLTPEQHFYCSLMCMLMRECAEEGIITDDQRFRVSTYVATKMTLGRQKAGLKSKLKPKKKK